jgi:putative addiction module component (TIGR02574 family)
VSLALDAIAYQVSALSAEQRMSLALALMESVETSASVKSNEAWSAEISRRIDEYDSGRVKGIPAEDVFRKLREMAPDP